MARFRTLSRYHPLYQEWEKGYLRRKYRSFKRATGDNVVNMRVYRMVNEFSTLTKQLDVEHCSACEQDHSLTVIPLLDPVQGEGDIVYKSQGICPNTKAVVYSTYDFGGI